MPTFDFANIINKIVRGALSAIANPVVILTTLAASFTAAVTAYVRYFTNLQLPQITLDDLSSKFSFVDSNWSQVVAYSIDYNTFQTIFNFVISLVTTLIPIILTFFTSLFALYWTFKAYQAIRASIKDVAG